MKVHCCASGSSGNLYSVCQGQTRIMIECGLPFKDMQRILPFPPSSYSCCIVSHRHQDHYNRKSAEELEARGVPVLLGDEISRGVLPMIFGGNNVFEIRAFDVPHDVPNYGFMIKHSISKETIVFATDCFYLPCKFEFSPTIWMLEANYAKDLLLPGESLNDRLYASHMEILQTIATLKANDLSKTREIWLLHMSDSRSDEARFIRDVEEATGVPTFAAQAWKRL